MKILWKYKKCFNSNNTFWKDYFLQYIITNSTFFKKNILRRIHFWEKKIILPSIKIMSELINPIGLICQTQFFSFLCTVATATSNRMLIVFIDRRWFFSRKLRIFPTRNVLLPSTYHQLSPPLYNSWAAYPTKKRLSANGLFF